jgi:hypothetical protein
MIEIKVDKYKNQSYKDAIITILYFYKSNFGRQMSAIDGVPEQTINSIHYLSMLTVYSKHS